MSHNGDRDPHASTISAGRDETREVFHERLRQAVVDSGMSRTAFARRAGVDRSSLSQMMNSSSTRLPRVETVATIARVAGVSTDWLLGLTHDGQMAADVLEVAVEIASGAAHPADERLRRWHAEAAGYKIRYVPASLPDLLKTEAVIRYEYEASRAPRTETRIEQAESRLEYSRRPETDMEVCSSVQSVEALARGEGIWRALPRAERREQLRHMARLLDELYPTLRWFLFDARSQMAVPLTVFGPMRASLYLGDMYLVFNTTEHIRVLTRYFDELIRAAVMQPPEVIAYLQRLAQSGSRAP